MRSSRRHGAGLTLEQLAERAGWSPFHLHRTFSEMVGETPKGYSLRLRLERAAARLVSTKDSVAEFPDPADWKTEVYWPLGK